MQTQPGAGGLHGGFQLQQAPARAGPMAGDPGLGGDPQHDPAGQRVIGDRAAIGADEQGFGRMMRTAQRVQEMVEADMRAAGHLVGHALSSSLLTRMGGRCPRLQFRLQPQNSVPHSLRAELISRLRTRLSRFIFAPEPPKPEPMPQLIMVFLA